MEQEQTIVGLRVDVDTYRGAREGVPRLLDALDKYQIEASFFFSVGPDNNGRRFWRLWDPTYLSQFVRTSFAGVEHHFKGAFWRGPVIGWRAADIIQKTDQSGHEVGLHAWDHHKWTTKSSQMSVLELRTELEKGYQLLSQILGREVTCSAAAGWRSSQPSLAEKEAFPFRYNSDCKGSSIFVPDSGAVPQIPVTLPTYEELIYTRGVNRKNYNEVIFSKIKPAQLNVYNIHAEIEGQGQFRLFRQWLEMAHERQVKIVPLGQLLPDHTQFRHDTIVNIAPDNANEWQSYQASQVSK